MYIYIYISKLLYIIVLYIYIYNQQHNCPVVPDGTANPGGCTTMDKIDSPMGDTARERNQNERMEAEEADSVQSGADSRKPRDEVERNRLVAASAKTASGCSLVADKWGQH